ncbi:hypothetical protein ABH926_005404 [Catenulispora sp. GP43]|uniref:hypothetical protein n=1 Tax=Catenulispora sp. GP43 TaxID=3156263 RepID=UPI003515C018
MTDQTPEDSVRGLFDQALGSDTPLVDLVPAALDGYGRKRRMRLAAMSGSTLAVLGTVALASVLVGGGAAPAGHSAGAGAPPGRPSASVPASPTRTKATDGQLKLSTTATLPGSASDYVPTSTISADCKGPWLAKPDAETYPNGAGPRTQEEASWACQQLLPALRKVLPGVTLQTKPATYTFKGTPGAPPPADGYPAAGLGDFQLTYNGGAATIDVNAHGKNPSVPDELQDPKTRCSQSIATCVKDGAYIVEMDKSFPEGTSFEVFAPDGTMATMAISGGVLPASGLPEVGGTFVPIPLTDAQLKAFDGNLALVRALEAALEHFKH